MNKIYSAQEVLICSRNQSNRLLKKFIAKNFGNKFSYHKTDSYSDQIFSQKISGLGGSVVHPTTISNKSEVVYTEQRVLQLIPGELDDRETYQDALGVIYHPASWWDMMDTASLQEHLDETR